MLHTNATLMAALLGGNKLLKKDEQNILINCSDFLRALQGGIAER